MGFGFNPSLDSDETGVRGDFGQEGRFSKETSGDEWMVWVKRSMFEGVLCEEREYHQLEKGKSFDCLSQELRPTSSPDGPITLYTVENFPLPRIPFGPAR